MRKTTYKFAIWNMVENNCILTYRRTGQFIFRQHGADMDSLHEPAKTRLRLGIPGGDESAQNE